MRIVRFHLEPWQKGGSEFSTPCASPCSLLIVSSAVHRRQRSCDIGEDILLNIAGGINAPTNASTLIQRKIRERLKRRYPQMVKRLTTICSDVIAKYAVSSHFFSKYFCNGFCHLF